MAIINELPEDVLMDILSWLPVKSILRSKSVSKNWYSLTQNPNFISLHRTRAPLCYCVYLERTIENDPYHWSMHVLPDQTSIHELDLSFTRPYLNKGFNYQGYCNGLMCLSLNSNIVICNPAMRECRLLPRPPYHTWWTDYLGFAFDPNTNDYKVVRVATFPETNGIGRKIHIYGMSADSWKELIITVPDHGLTSIYHHHPCISLGGNFYWLGHNIRVFSGTVDALKMVERSFEQRSLPVGITFDPWPILCLLNDSLALVVPTYDDLLRETKFDVWLTDVHGVQERWTKKYTIGPISGSRRPFGFVPNSEVLMTGCDDNGIIVMCNHNTGDIKEYKQLHYLLNPRRPLSHVFQYSESLVSVKRRVDLA